MGKLVELELDTGAAATVMSELVFRQLFPDKVLQKSKYTGQVMKTAGEILVQVSYQDQEPKDLPLIVVKGNGPTLLGLHYFVLDWNSIKPVIMTQDSLQRLLHKYSDIFKDELGTITPVEAKLLVSATATPKFHRPRPVPYALKPLVEQELHRLERARVLEKVDHSEWAAPVVAVPKKDGAVRLCGDYKVTINPFLDVDQYPLPRPEELFATLAGGKYFSTLDLSHAYNQVILDNESRKFLTINTHRGLYQYTRLPFGVASAPSIFQKTMDWILQGLDGVICYLDDILVMGKTEAEHLENLRRVFDKLKEHGMRLKKSKCLFMQKSVQYLGHIVDAVGIHATDAKLKAIVDAPVPKNVTKLQSFLGLINYYSELVFVTSSFERPPSPRFEMALVSSLPTCVQSSQREDCFAECIGSLQPQTSDPPSS